MGLPTWCGCQLGLSARQHGLGNLVGGVPQSNAASATCHRLRHMSSSRSCNYDRRTHSPGALPHRTPLAHSPTALPWHTPRHTPRAHSRRVPGTLSNTPQAHNTLPSLLRWRTPRTHSLPRRTLPGPLPTACRGNVHTATGPLTASACLSSLPIAGPQPPHSLPAGPQF